MLRLIVTIACLTSVVVGQFSSSPTYSTVDWRGNAFRWPQLAANVHTLASYDSGAGEELWAGGGWGYLGGQSFEGPARWNGATWSLVPVTASSPSGSASIRTIRSLDTGSGPELYVSGQFSSIDGTTANRIARWDGQAWHALGGGLSGEALELAVYDDGTGAALYATVSGSGLQKYDGASWTQVAPGVFPTTMVVMDDGNGDALFLGGNFTSVNGVPATRVARWDGSQWSALGNGLDATVRSLEVFDSGSGPELIAGGDFTLRVSRWDGTSWSPLGGGFFQTGSVFDLEVYDHGVGPALYAAGGFFDIGNGIHAKGLARWDGSQWQQVVDTPLDSTHRLAVWNDAGTPKLAVTVLKPRGSVIFTWDGTTWECATDRVGGDVKAFESYDMGAGQGTRLYAGGDIQTPVGLNAVMEYDGCNWSTLGAGPDLEVRSLCGADLGAGPRLYAGTERTPQSPVGKTVMEWDGSTWTPVGPPVPSWQLVSFRVLVSGDIGQGPRLWACDHYYGTVWEFDGGTWTEIGASLGFVRDLCLFDDGTGTQLHACGGFTGFVARWDGTSWTAGPSPVANTSSSTRANTLTTHLGDLWVGLRIFDPSGYWSTGSVQRLTGGSYSLTVYDSADYGQVTRLASSVDGTNPALFVSGQFDQLSPLGPIIPPLLKIQNGLASTPSPAHGGQVDTMQGILHADLGSTLAVGGRMLSGGSITGAGALFRSCSNPQVALTQSGPGAPVVLDNSKLAVGLETYNLFSVDTCGGTGPWLGLCFTNVVDLINQVSLPLGTPYRHFIASSSCVSWPPIPGIPGGISVEAVTVQLDAGQLIGWSPVTAFTSQ